MLNEHPNQSMNALIHSQNNIPGDIEQARHKTISPKGNHGANQQKAFR